jgi:hypothetical protein
MLTAEFEFVCLPKAGETVFVVPVGAEERPEAWWKATLVKVDSSCPKGAFLVRSQHGGGAPALGQWVRKIVRKNGS